MVQYSRPCGFTRYTHYDRTVYSNFPGSKQTHDSENNYTSHNYLNTRITNVQKMAGMTINGILLIISIVSCMKLIFR